MIIIISHKILSSTFVHQPKTPPLPFPPILPFLTKYIHSPLPLCFRANRRIFHGCLKFDKNRAPPPVSLGQQGTGPITIGNACISRSFRVSLPLSTAAAGIRALWRQMNWKSGNMPGAGARTDFTGRAQRSREPSLPPPLACLSRYRTDRSALRPEGRRSIRARVFSRFRHRFRNRFS